MFKPDRPWPGRSVIFNDSVPVEVVDGNNSGSGLEEEGRSSSGKSSLDSMID